MTPETSEGYAQFQDLVRWCADTWTNKIQPGQEWFASKLHRSVRQIKRYFQQARLDGFMETIRRYRRTCVLILKNQQVGDRCPYNVPTVVPSTPDIHRKEMFSPLVIFRDIRSRFAAKARETSIQ